MEQNNIIKEQFNKGAQNFDNWSVTQNEKMMKGMTDFCDLSNGDDLLDVACGTGGFSLYAANLVNSVSGVDISEGMIVVANKNAEERKLKNVEFYCQDVENIKLPNKAFSVVVSRSAFHHMKNYKKVFSEMVHYCENGGSICIQDIIAYDNDKLDNYFEQMELLIDRSHYKTYSKSEFFKLFKENQIKILGIFESESELNFYDYVHHLEQNHINDKEIEELLNRGLSDADISTCFIKRNDRLLWKRKVCTIIGYKNV